MATNALKLSTMVGENLEIYLSQMATNALKLSTMVGENLDIYLSNGCNCPMVVPLFSNNGNG